MEIHNVNLQANHVGLRPRLTEKCPRCNSMDTKFCYYNNYSLNQPRHYCKTCRRYWTQGGICRNIPIGGSSYRRNRRVRARARAAHPHATLDPNVPTFAKRRRRSTNAGSINVSGGRGRRSIIPSIGVNFPNELENRVTEFGHTMSSFGSTPVLSFNNKVVNVNNNAAPGLGTSPPPRPPPPALMNGDAWHQESLSLTSVQQDDNMGFWSFDGPPLFPYDIDVVINDQWLHDLPEYTMSTSLPPPPPSA